jgi:hypothetical protein
MRRLRQEAIRTDSQRLLLDAPQAAVQRVASSCGNSRKAFFETLLQIESFGSCPLLRATSCFTITGYFSSGRPATPLCLCYAEGCFAQIVPAMNIRLYTTLIVAALILCSAPAHAFRCGNKIVTEDMHEAQVRAACGTPTTSRIIGRTVQNINVPIQRVHGGGWTQKHFPGYAFAQ